jgi:hypothetical protein
MIPMALSLGYGIVFATAITLIIVPCLYMILEDVKRAFAWVYRGGLLRLVAAVAGAAS